MLAVGDQLLLTKPLGTGALTTALKNDALTEGDLAEAIAGMRKPNRAAVRPLHAVPSARRRIAGFNLIGLRRRNGERFLGSNRHRLCLGSRLSARRCSRRAVTQANGPI
jgi:hypothetical protein